MKFLLGEDDLSLINGLFFAIKKQGYDLDIARICLDSRNSSEVIALFHYFT